MFQVLRKLRSQFNAYLIFLIYIVDSRNLGFTCEPRAVNQIVHSLEVTKLKFVFHSVRYSHSFRCVLSSPLPIVSFISNGRLSEIFKSRNIEQTGMLYFYVYNNQVHTFLSISERNGLAALSAPRHVGGGRAGGSASQGHVLTLPYHHVRAGRIVQYIWRN